MRQHVSSVRSDWARATTSISRSDRTRHYVACMRDSISPMLHHVMQEAVRLTLNGATTTRHFFLNASAGITAEGNRQFNHPGPVLGMLKRVSVRAAITYAAITSLIGYENIPVRLTIPQAGTITLALTNLGIVKTPYFLRRSALRHRKRLHERTVRGRCLRSG